MSWTLPENVQLPKWATYTQDTDGIYKLYIDSDAAYPDTLRQIEGAVKDHYWYGIAQHIIIEDLKALCGNGVRIKFLPSEVWCLARLPMGRGEDSGMGDAPFAYLRLKAKREQPLA